VGFIAFGYGFLIGVENLAFQRLSHLLGGGIFPIQDLLNEFIGHLVQQVVLCDAMPVEISDFGEPFFGREAFTTLPLTVILLTNANTSF
jgi:hypothetical protein